MTNLCKEECDVRDSGNHNFLLEVLALFPLVLVSFSVGKTRKKPRLQSQLGSQSSSAKLNLYFVYIM